MANTADTLGEQETLDGLVAHTLKDFEDNRITNVRSYAFYNNDKIESINLPNVRSIRGDAFSGCKNLHTVKLPSIRIYDSREFQDCYKLKNVTFPSSYPQLPEYMFDNCFSLNNIDSEFDNVGRYTFQNSGIGKFTTKNLSNEYSFIYSRVSTVEISTTKSNVNVYSDSLSYAYSLVHFIINVNYVIGISGTSSNLFNNTPIKQGLGWIYVPSNLVDSYKSATNWSAYADQIVSIDEYPKALDGETITDSWGEIFQAEDNDTYKTKYSVGDTKYLVIGGTYVLMQIIAFDRDILSSDHTSTAKITWLQKNLSFKFPMIFTLIADGGWADCECRKFLSDTIYGQIPENVQNKILAVDKTYYTGTVSGTATCSDKLWIPSRREVSSKYPYESSGVDYTDFFVDNSSRIKKTGLMTNLNASWQLRSSNNTSTNSMYYNIANSGDNGGSSGGNGVNYFPIGFCT